MVGQRRNLTTLSIVRKSTAISIPGNFRAAYGKDSITSGDTGRRPA